MEVIGRFLPSLKNDKLFNMSPLEKELSKLFISATFHHKGLIQKDGWDCDQWLCTIQYEKNSATFDYYTGLGHRELMPGVTRKGNLFDPRYGDSVWSDRQAAEKKFTKVKQPKLADLVHSLLLNLNSIEQSFQSWCDEFGESEDSLKALNTYLACQKEADKVLRLFGRELCAKLRELEH